MYYWVGLQLVLRVVLFAVSSLDRNINLLIGIVLFSLMEGIHGAVRPLRKSSRTSYHEQMFIKNLLILFVIALYSQDTPIMIAVNVMIGLAMVHFSMIIFYHIITYVLSEVTRNKLHLHINTFIGWITRKEHVISDQQFEMQNYFKMKYHAEATEHDGYQEPLIFRD